MWIGERLKTENTPKSISEHQAGIKGSDNWLNYVLTESKITAPTNLVGHCINIANVKDTFVTCILADQDWY